MKKTQKALVVHTGGGLGDVLLSRPVVDTLTSHGFQVDFLARESTSPALLGHQGVSELLTIAQKDPANLQEMKTWAKKLQSRDYQVAMLLWSTSRWAWTLRLAGIPQRVGQDSRLLYSFTFTHPVKVRSEHGDTESHWTDILLDYPRALGLEPTEPSVIYPVPEQAQKTARQLLEGFDFGNQSGPILGFHSGKGLPLGPQRWPVQHFTRIAQQLQDDLGARLVLTGGPSEIELVQAVSSKLRAPFLNLAGQTDLSGLAAIASLCEVFICPDSGPMHLAAAVGTPVVGIYALDEDFPQRWAPFGVPHRVIRPARPACPPGCRKPSCPNFSCYLKVQPGEVVEATQQLLQEKQAQEGSCLSGGNGLAL